MGYIHWIGIDGTETIEVAYEAPSLSRMQDYIGGYIASVPILLAGGTKKAIMYVDEDGYLKSLPVNRRATDIMNDTAEAVGCPLEQCCAPIVGPAIILEDIPPHSATTNHHHHH